MIIMLIIIIISS